MNFIGLYLWVAEHNIKTDLNEIGWEGVEFTDYSSDYGLLEDSVPFSYVL
jgi:hypothetical protein